MREEHDSVRAGLSDRRSVVHYAHAAVTSLAGLILSGVASKLEWDLGDSYPWAAAPVAVMGVAVLSYAGARWVLAGRAARREAVQIKRLTELRAALKLDGPASASR